MEECASSHDEEDQAVVYEEIVDTSMLKGSITCSNDDGAMSFDYEDDDMAAPHAPLAVSYEVHDTNTFDR